MTLTHTLTHTPNHHHASLVQPSARICEDTPSSPPSFTALDDQFALQGACCTAALQARVEAAGTLTDACADLSSR